MRQLDKEKLRLKVSGNSSGNRTRVYPILEGNIKKNYSEYSVGAGVSGKRFNVQAGINGYRGKEDGYKYSGIAPSVRVNYRIPLSKKKTGGSVPQRRNKNAGKFTGKSESSKYFATHPEARRKKNEYNTEYHSTPERKTYRAELNSYTKKKRTPGKDVSHLSGGGFVRENRSANRARNGKNGKSSKK